MLPSSSSIRDRHPLNTNPDVPLPTILRDRLTVEYRTQPETETIREGQDVVLGLSTTPKSLPPKYFYDDRGSKLFEAITQLPEYYLTRTETTILQNCVSAIAARVGPCDLIELGSGSSTKTRILLDAYRQINIHLRYVPVDVSGSMLEETAHLLLQEYPQLSIHGLVSTYENALANLPDRIHPSRMIAFIGSTLGNLAPHECETFLGHVSAALQPNDYFLLGIDLHKDTAILEAAYNDSQGITAAFNLNMLDHLNWRFQGNFDLQHFRHVSFYNTRDRQIEMHIESLRSQIVNLRSLEFTATFATGEKLLSEISRKFEIPEIQETLSKHHLNAVETFTDSQRWFALILCQKKP